jgi:hypothetical protein
MSTLVGRVGIEPRLGVASRKADQLIKSNLNLINSSTLQQITTNKSGS